MFENFSRRNHLDQPDYDLKYEYVPPAFRLDIYKAVRENCENKFQEYFLFRDGAISINKLVPRFYSIDEIDANYSPDFFIGMLLELEWHQMLAIIEFFLGADSWYKAHVTCQNFLTTKQVNVLFEYHKLGYRVEESSYSGYPKIIVYYDELIEDNEKLLLEDIPYQPVKDAVESARKYLIDPNNIDIGNSVVSSVKAVESYLKGYFGKQKREPANLGDCIKELKNQNLCPKDIIGALNQLYIYRHEHAHGSPKNAELTIDDALLCNAMAISFINYFHRKLPDLDC